MAAFDPKGLGRGIVKNFTELQPLTTGEGNIMVQ